MQIPKTHIAHHTPFGSMVENRSWSAGNGYRFGFNGQEGDDQVKGKGNSLDFGARVYDSRLGKFISLDPLKAHPKLIGLSPYQFANNSPIAYIDDDGEIPLLVITGALAAVGNMAIGIYKGEEIGDVLQRGVVGFAVGAGAGLFTAGAAAVAGGVSVSTAAGFTMAETAALLGGGGLAQITLLGGAFSSGAGNLLDQGIDILRGEKDKINGEEVMINVLVGYGSGALSIPASMSKEAIQKAVVQSLDDKLLEAGIEGVKDRVKKRAARKATKFIQENGSDYALRFKATVDGGLEILGSVGAGMIEEDVSEKLINDTPSVEDEGN